jgi:butyrate kinase
VSILKVLLINPGATSTKIAVYEEDQEIMRRSVDHDAATIDQFAHIADQMPYRRDMILDILKEEGYSLTDFDAICGRGGLFKHIPSGTYLVNDAVIRDILHPPYGEHAANLGAYIAKSLADQVGIPAFFVDPVSTDELSPLARYSGLKGIERESFFHALNQKSVARRTARELGRAYEDLNLIVVHLGGGVSVAAHDHGRVVDNYNVKDDGAMGLDRGGALPVNAVINLCYTHTKAEMKRLVGQNAGVYSYTGTKDFREVERRAFEDQDPEALGAWQAIAYQLAKDIGAMAAVLHFQVDAITLTGGMAHSDRFCDEIEGYVKTIAPVLRMPGEEEMRSLAEGAFRALHSGKWENYQ